ncbi:F-box family protein [Striga asiatica]|uniref:F-box family protein n=1 Tax=Striga asiatica TaxID=4170 RepID=A0A5A7RD30_STRAF|nr:F-box family protein [Striga asiatica]
MWIRDPRVVFGLSGRKSHMKISPIHVTLLVAAPQLDNNPNLLIVQESGSSKRVRTSIEVFAADSNFDNGLEVLLSNISEDLLSEILVRLPNCRFAIQLSSVCRRWHSLISQPRFIPSFIRLHQDRDQSYTILFRMNYRCIRDTPEYYQLVCTLFSEESLLIHGKRALLSPSNYLDFMPSLMVVRASCNDLLLVSPDTFYLDGRFRNHHQRYYICNPVTKKWFLIPGETPLGTRAGFALICNKNSYKVVLLDKFTTVDAKGKEFVDAYGHTVSVFCSESGQWTRSFFLFPPRPTRDYAIITNVVSCNGILYWMDGLYNLDRIVSFDLANNRFPVIYFPDIVRDNTTNDTPDSRVHIGAVRDELRLLHILRAGPGRKCFVMRAWELDRGDDMWALVGERELSFPDAVTADGDRDTVVAAVFHPKDYDSIFVICGKSVYECGISKDTCRRLGELPESVGDEGLASFALLHPPWPTPIPFGV